MEDLKIEANAGGSAKFYDFGPFRLSANERLLFEGEEARPLPGKAFDLLLLLVESAGHLKSREELIEALWPNTIVEENSLTWYVSAIRKALGDEGEARQYVETVHGHGYRFIAPVVAKTPQPQRLKDAKRKAWPWIAGLAAIAIACGALIWHFSFRGAPETTQPTPVIAVLPFENMSANSNNAYFADGIQDTILSKLAGIGGLRVISRTSTERYPSHPANLKRIASQLGATAMMEGSVQKSGDRVLINVQLIDARTNEHIWAHVYTRSLRDVFAVEQDVASQVTAALKAQLLPEETAQLAKSHTSNPKAYLLYLKANYYANQVTESNSAKNFSGTIHHALDLYRQAINLDPSYALAWARLSYLKSDAYWHHLARTAKDMAEAEHAAKRALELDPNLAQGHFAMGYVELSGHHNLAAALSQFEQAHRLLPNDADVIGAISLVYKEQGKWKDALSELRQAKTLDPRNAHWPYEAGFARLMLRQYDRAVRQFNLALALAPDNYHAAIMRATTAIVAGKPEHQIQKILKETPRGSSEEGGPMVIRFLAASLAHRPDEALAALDSAPDWVSAPTAVGVEPTSLLLAQGLTLKGEPDQAKAAYQEAVALLRDRLQERPQEASLWSFLGLAAAGLGQKPEAIQAGLKATRLAPVSRNALYGPSHRATLAKIYAQAGEPEKAIKLLRRLLAMPAGLYISVPLLERDPIWNPLRRNPQFQNLLKKHRKAPTTASETYTD